MTESEATVEPQTRDEPQPAAGPQPAARPQSAAVTQPATKPRRGRGRPSTTLLNRDHILDTARALIEREGPDALTLRRLGTDLGTNHTAVLRHFSGKDDIVLGLAERLIAEAIEGFTPSDTWRDTLAALARRVRGACLAHPAIALLVATRVSRRAAEFQGADIVVAALLEAGFAEPEAARYYRVLVDTALAFSSYEAAHLALDEDLRSADRMAWRREYLLADPATYPSLASVAPFLAEADEQDQFETILELVLDAVELRAQRARKV